MLVLWPTISTDNRKQFSRLLAREPTEYTRYRRIEENKDKIRLDAVLTSQT